MRLFIEKCRENEKLKKVLFKMTFVFLFLVCVFSLTFEKVFPLNYVNIVFFAFFCLFAVACGILYKFKFRVDIYVIVLCSLFILMLTSYAYNGFKQFPRTPLLMILYSLFIYYWIQNRKEKIDIYLFSFVIATWIFIAAFAFVERSHLIHLDFSYRVGGFFGNVNDVARHFVFALILNVFFACRTKNNILRIISILSSLAILYFTLLTGSISNLLLSIILLVFVSIYITPKKFKLVVLFSEILVVGLIFLLVFTVPSLEPFKKRITGISLSLFNVNIGNDKMDGSAAQRLNVAIYGLRLFLESPLFGSGYNSVFTNYYVMAHNNIVEIAADYGFLALFAEQVKILYPLFVIKKVNKEKRLLVLMLCIYLFGIQFFLVSFNSKIESFLIPVVYLLIENCLDYKDFKSLLDKEEKVGTSKEKIKLCEIIPRLTPLGGAEKMVVDMCINIAKNRPDVDLLFVILYDEDDNYLMHSLKEAGVNTVTLGKKKGIDFKAAKRLSEVVNEFEPDIIHSHLVSLITIFLADLHNEYPIFHTIHTTPNKVSKGSKLKPNNIFERYLFKTSIVPVAISENVRNEISRYYGKGLDEIPVIENGVDLLGFSAEKPYKDREIDFLYAGRFIKTKNVPLIIKAFEKFSLENKNVNLSLAGTGENFDECFNYAKQNNIKNINFLGFVSDMSSLLSQTKVLVMASSVEGNPIIVNEAVASKTYVLSSNVGGISDVVNDTCGLLYDQIDADTLCEKMRWCYENFLQIEEKIKLNYQKNTDKISINKTVDGYISLFKSI